MRKQNITYKEALMFVLEQRTSVEPNENFVSQLQQFEQLLKTLSKIWTLFIFYQ